MVESIAAETGLPARRPGPLRGDALWNEIKTAVDALPWVGGDR